MTASLFLNEQPEPAPDPHQLPAAPGALAELLRTSVPAGARNQRAAIDLIATVYDGSLLTMQRVRRCIVVDGSKVYIHWPSLIADQEVWPGPNSSRYSEDGVPALTARHIVRLAALLHAGELTSEELLAAGDAFYDSAGDPIVPSPELIRAYLVEYPGQPATAPDVDDIVNALRVTATEAALLVRYFDQIRTEIKLSGPDQA